MILSQEYVAEDRKAYSYLVFDYYSLYYKLLETIVSFFLSEGDGTSLRERRHSERLEQMERYISIHYNEPITLEELSQEFYLSKAYLSRSFTQSFGIGFSQYLKELRLKRAMSDILYTDKPITQISFDNGFTSSSYFNRVFREKYHKSPSEIRKSFVEGEKDNRKSETEEQSLHSRVSRLLGENPAPISSLSQEKHFRYSVLSSVPITRCWNSIINIGSAADILRTDIQEHMGMLSKLIHYRYARLWDPFSKELLLDVNEFEFP